MSEEIPASRERDLPRPVLAAIGLALMAAVVGLYVVGKSLDLRVSVFGNPGMFPRQGPIRSVEEFAGIRFRDQLVGRDVFIASVRVTDVIADHTFWIGEGFARVPVVLKGELTGRQKEFVRRVREGQVVRVFGEVRPLLDVNAIEPDWNLEAKQKKDLSEQEVYISADRVYVDG